MAEKKAATKGTQNAAKGSAAGKASATFTEEERAAMREHAREVKASANRGKSAEKIAGESDVLSKLAAMTASDRALGERLHAIVKANAPDLTPKLWYGMPAYANENGNVVCFFQDAQKFKSRYATLGFSDKANLDEGVMWPTSFALKEITPAEEARIAALVKKAVS
ncbi:MAG TPA: DUF1801 domain-containing protein [Terracidiphilus sp.]|nr:DUF1801 domain-containing protein [Terracidiphilus sp.]